MRLTLEIIVQSVEDAVAAEAGGADRLEVVRAIEQDGLTPALETVRGIAAATRLPLRVMVRDTDTFTVADSSELLRLQRAFAAFAALGVDGAVVGFSRDGEVDLPLLDSVLAAAPHMRVTFHRAFDSLRDPREAIRAVRERTQIDRILTSGGHGTWTDRCARLRDLAARAGPGLEILAGGGVDVPGLQHLAAAGSIREAHVGRAACEPPVPGAPVSAERVRTLRDAADGAPRHEG